MKTKLLLVVNVLLIAAVLLSACAPAAAPAPAQAPAQSQPAQAQPTEKPAEAKPTDAPQPTETPKETTITIWHQWDGKYLDSITQVFKDYEAAHPGVKIDLSKPEQVQEALQVAVPAGEGPDIIGWANDRIGDQALIGNIVALDDFGMTADALKATYEPAAVSGVTWNGKTWALPESQEGIALIYNKDVVKEEDLPKDLDDLLAKAEAFQKDNPGKVLVCNSGFGASDAYHLAPIYFGNGVPSFVDDQGKAYLNTPEAVNGAEWLSKMAQFSLKTS